MRIGIKRPYIVCRAGRGLLSVWPCPARLGELARSKASRARIAHLTQTVILSPSMGPESRGPSLLAEVSLRFEALSMGIEGERGSEGASGLSRVAALRFAGERLPEGVPGLFISFRRGRFVNQNKVTLNEGPSSLVGQVALPSCQYQWAKSRKARGSSRGTCRSLDQDRLIRPAKV